jgi:hypothetical protein
MFVVAGVVGLLGIAAIDISARWSFYRWHWPFLPRDVANLIRAGELLVADDSVFNRDAIAQWRNSCEATISRWWGETSKQMNEYRKPNLTNDPLDAMTYREIEIIDQQIAALKGLKASP